jgi:predicted secreted hydrolase
MRKVILLIILLGLVALLFLIPAIFERGNGEQIRSQLASAAAQIDTSGFRRAEGPIDIQFPQDQGPHNDFQSEWWYYTGNLGGPGGRHFGFQLTFFRRALLPPDQVPERGSDLAANQVYMAHFAMTDVSGKRFQAFERLARGAGGLSGAQAAPYHVWLEDWSVSEVAANTYQVHAAMDGLGLDLTLHDEKGPVLQGDQGYSRKGPQPGQASYYYSQTRLKTSGSLTISGDHYAVSGLSWMDHEYSTSALAQDQVGWDWFALQLDSGSELMVYQLRKVDGSIDPFSSGTLVNPDGSTQLLDQTDYTIQVEGTWKSPHSQAVYPSRWHLTVPEAGLELDIEPYLADQELNLSYTYWEGAVKFSGEQNGKPVQGNGYIELTGYAGSMGGKF